MKFLRRLTSNKLTLIGAVIILLLVLVGIFAEQLAPHDPLKMNTTIRFLKPFVDSIYPLGTDELGRDVLSRIIFGVRISLVVSVLSVMLATIIGIILGITAGYFGGVLEMIIMRTTDVLFSIPSLIMAIILVGIFGRSMVGITLALAVGYIPMTIRVVFSTTLSERGSGYVEASKAMGASAIRILSNDIFPNILPTIIVQMTCAISWAILSESSLGFIGLGVNPPTPTWGLMLSKARETVYTAPWLAIFPGLAIMVAVFAFNILGDGLRDLFDPRAWNSGD